MGGWGTSTRGWTSRAALLLAFALACSPPEGGDGGALAPDASAGDGAAGFDASGSDAGADARADAGADASPEDATVDGGGQDAAALDGARDPDAATPGVGAGTSFVVEVDLSYLGSAPSGLPRRLTGTLFLREVDGGLLEAVTGTDGAILEETIARTSAGPWPLRWIWRPREPLGECARVASASLTAEVALHDDDGDGAADGARGAGSGRLQYVVSDFMETFADFTATVTARVEHDPPTLRWVQSVPTHVPLTGGDAPVLVASEPVTAPSGAWLEAPDGRRLPLHVLGSGALAAAWSQWPSEVLPYDVALEPRFEGAITDQTGLPLVAPPLLPTLPIPAPVAREGFEAGTTAHVEGTVSFVSALGTLAPIAGARSALVEPADGTGGGQLVVRLQAPGGATAVRMAARYLARTAAPPGLSWGSPTIEVRVVALDGETSSAWTGPSATSRIPTGDARWVEASEVVTISVPLPASATDEVALVIGRDWGCAGMLPYIPATPLLIDDVRVE